MFRVNPVSHLVKKTIPMTSQVKGSIASFHVLQISAIVVATLITTVEGTIAFDCKNSKISDEWRQLVLAEVNNYRRSLAQGKVQDKTEKFLPAAKNMNELKWECNLEDMAYKSLQSLMSTCDVPPLSISPPYQTMEARFPKEGYSITSLTKTILYAWWNRIKDETVRYVGNNKEPSIPTALNFAVMATAETTGFACTYEFCNNMPKGIMVCIYDDKTANVSVANRIIYKPASNAQEICSACSNNCTKSLCN